MIDYKKFLIAQKNYHTYKIVKELFNYSYKKDVVFLCVGNPKVWYDSFGPIMGTLLKVLKIENFVYGDINNPILPNNIKDYIKIIKSNNIKSKVIIIDSAINKNEENALKLIKKTINCAFLSDDNVNVGDISLIYSFGKEFISNQFNYYEIIKDIKTVIRYLKYLLIDCKM